MAASDHLNADQHGPMQLPMFMRAGDLLGSLTATADRSLDPPEEVMDTKLGASLKPVGQGHGAGVHESVSQHGVLNPVQLIHAQHGNLMMGQGHHRVAAAAEIESETRKDKWVPVIHTDARETSSRPLSIHSDVDEKKAAIADYRNWSTYTPAIGQDVGWKQREETAAEKVKSEILKRSEARPLPSRYRDMSEGM